MITSSSSRWVGFDYQGMMRMKGRKENEDFNSDGMDLGCRMAFLLLARRRY
jgi:hypothetical protein